VQKNMPEKPNQNEISTVLKNFVEIENPKSLSQFCVDGRKGNGPGIYLQALGGSYHLVTLNWLLSGGKASEYQEIQQETFIRLRNHGYHISVHRGGHAHEDKSDCGFADNNGTIIKTMVNRGDEIWELMTQVEPSLESEKQTWQEIQQLVARAEVDKLPPGETLINQAVDGFQADLQTLEGEHQEIAAIVNLKRNTSLDVDKNQKTQAFNLDLWYILDQAKDLGLDEKKSLLLSLGLYIATEMVLVENKGKPRLPIVIRR